MPNVAITLTNSQTGVTQATKIDSEGNYEFPVVRPGNYSLKAEQAGFKTFVQNAFSLSVDERSRVDAVMQVGETATAVTVEASPVGVQTESSALGDVVDNKKIVELPLNGRFFLDLALLTAGTTVPSTNNRTFLAVPSGIGIPASTRRARAKTPPTTWWTASISATWCRTRSPFNRTSI